MILIYKYAVKIAVNFISILWLSVKASSILYIEFALLKIDVKLFITLASSRVIFDCENLSIQRENRFYKGS